jgi:hypothetical protein
MAGVGLRPVIARHSSTPQAVFSIGAGGGSVRFGATFPSSRTTTSSPGASPQSSTPQVKTSPSFEQDHLEAGQYLDPLVTRASGKSDPGGKVMRWVSAPRPKRSRPVTVNS